MVLPACESNITICSEPTSINTVRINLGILNSSKNPFHGGGQSERSTIIHSPIEKEEKKSPDKASTHLPSPSCSSSTFHKEEENPFLLFPYISHLNPELEANFELMHEQLQTLPCEIEELTLTLPPLPTESMKTLILDLDETLIHTMGCFPLEENSKGRRESIMLGEEAEVFFDVRPHLDHFLQKLAPHFEIIVFSAGTKEYTSKIIEKLDPEGRYIRAILDRTKCIQRDGYFYIKDLRILANRDLANLVFIDNMPFSFFNQMSNGIYVPSFEGAEDDSELLTLLPFLLSLVSAADVRPLVEKFAGIVELFNQFSTTAEGMEMRIIESEEEIDEGLNIGVELE